MTCRYLQQRLFGDPEAFRRETTGVEAHLSGCEECRRLHAAWSQVEQRLLVMADGEAEPRRDLERTAVELWLAERQLRAIRSSEEPSVSTRPRWFFFCLVTRSARHSPSRRVAAAALLLAALGVMLVGRGQRRSPGRQEPAVVKSLPGGHGAPAVPRARPKRGRQLVVRPLIPMRPQGRGQPPLLGSSNSGVAADNDNRRSSRLSSLSRAPIVDDLIFVNQTSKPTDQRDPGVPPDEWDKVEARVRRLVHVRDDFVTIPFPRLVTTSDRQIARAVESYKREAAIVDPRLSREVTLQFKAAALSDLCLQLQAETAIHLTAGASVADEKVTLFCKRQPLRDVMRQLARPFGYTWLRSGLPSPSGGGAGGRGFRYELVQDLRSQLLEEELRNRARNEALLALDREIQRYRPYLALSPDEALARSKSAPPEQKKLLENLADRGWGAIQMYFRLAPRDLDTLRARQPLNFAQDPHPGDQLQPPDQLLPPDIARGVLESLRAARIRDDRGGQGGVIIREARDLPDGVSPASFREARARVRMKFGHSELGQFTFDADAGVYVGTRIYLTGGECATGTSSAIRDPNNADTHAAWARDPALNSRVTVRPQPSCRPAAGASGPASSPREARATSADVLEALHHATGLPVAADYYTHLFPLPSVSLQNVTLFDALNRLADTMRLRWNRDKEGGWLQFRSVSYYDDRLKEVPNRLLFRWAASRRQHGALTLDDLIEIAGLTDVQLDSPTTAEGARDCFDLVEWDLTRGGTASLTRTHLRYLATLTPAQRQSALTTTGLPFSQLSLAQQQQLLAHLGPRLGWAHIQSLEQLSGAVVRLEYTQPGGFRWLIPETVRRAGEHGPPSPSDRLRGGMFGLSPVWARTRDATLQAARRIDPGVDPTQIAPTELAVAIVYMLTDPTTGDLQPLGVRGAPGGVRINW
jgi:hypothetical protein